MSTAIINSSGEVANVDNSGNLCVTLASSGSNTNTIGTVVSNADASVGAGAAPSKAVVVGAQYNSSAPAPTTTQTQALQSDAYGNLFVNGIRRSQIKPVTGNIASATPATLLAAQAAGIYADLAGIVFTLRQGTSANIFFGVLISDGTNTYRFNFMSQSAVNQSPQAPISISFNPLIPATSAATAWTIALTSATDSPSVDYVCTFIFQKAS